MTCIQLYTPTTIKENLTHDDGTAIDCFTDAIPSSNIYKTAMHDMLWAKYRYHMINSCNVTRWLQDLKDRAYILDRRWTVIFGAYADSDNDFASLYHGYKDTYNTSDRTSHTGSDSQTETKEKIPQTTGASASTWLSERDIRSVTPGVTDTLAKTGTVLHEVQDMLLAEEFEALITGLKDPYEVYADQYKDMFVNRWGGI